MWQLPAASGTWYPASTFIRVLLPEPLCPTRACTSPAGMSRSIDFRACCPPKDLSSVRMEIAGPCSGRVAPVTTVTRPVSDELTTWRLALSRDMPEGLVLGLVAGCTVVDGRRLGHVGRGPQHRADRGVHRVGDAHALLVAGHHVDCSPHGLTDRRIVE